MGPASRGPSRTRKTRSLRREASRRRLPRFREALRRDPVLTVQIRTLLAGRELPRTVDVRLRYRSAWDDCGGVGASSTERMRTIAAKVLRAAGRPATAALR